ncbi:hypothetical protein WN55_00969 [Dufourea novaeangliae]|nr:hypothetical protein WN55_00969 [Dufourea novaeangliae]
MLNSVSYRLELLNKDNFDTWRMQVEALLTKNDLWQYVSGEKVKPNVTENPATVEPHAMWLKHDKKAKSDLILSISPSELKQLKGCETSREMWLKFFDCVDKLAAMEVEINKDLLSIMLLYSLPSSFENFRCAIESRDNLPDVESLKVKILEESDARKQKNDADVIEENT